MKIKAMTMIVLVGFLTVLVGCVSKSDYVTTAEFEKMSADERQRTMEELQQRPQELQGFWLASLKAYRPVDFQFGDTDYTLKCQWFPNDNYRQLVVYEGRNSVNLDRNADQAMLILAANGNCEAQLATNEGGQTKAIIVAQHSGMPEGFVGALLKRTTPAFVNGMGAVALRDVLGPECDNCGAGYNVFNVMAASQSQSQSNLDANIGNCADGKCGPPKK